MLTDWDPVWAATAARLDATLQRGLGHLLTEDAIRWAASESIVELEVARPDQLDFELSVGLSGRVDLVVEPNCAAIEFKFPRLPRRGNAPMTQHHGSLIADFVRLNEATRFEQRLIVQYLLPEIEIFLLNRPEIKWRFEAGQSIAMNVDLLRSLPATARGQLPEWALADDWGPLEATCIASSRTTAGLLVAYAIS